MTKQPHSPHNSQNHHKPKTLSLALICLAIILVSVNMRSPIVMLGSIAPMIEQALIILTALMTINVIFAWTASKAVMIDGEKIPC